MPDVRCKPESALCPAQPADLSAVASAGTSLQLVAVWSVCLGQVADAVQQLQVEWSQERGTKKPRFRVLQAFAEHGGPVSAESKRAGNLPHLKSFLGSLVDQRTPQGRWHRDLSFRDRRKSVLWTKTESRRALQSQDPEPVADAALAEIWNP
jgi:hypothetical protein